MNTKKYIIKYTNFDKTYLMEAGANTAKKADHSVDVVEVVPVVLNLDPKKSK